MILRNPCRMPRTQERVVDPTMTLRNPDDTKNARIVVHIAGPVARLHLRHVPADWVVFTTGHGPDLVADVEKLRRRAERNGYKVEPGYIVEDWNPKITGARNSWAGGMVRGGRGN
jgi:hypothetical protein